MTAFLYTWLLVWGTLYAALFFAYLIRSMLQTKCGQFEVFQWALNSAIIAIPMAAALWVYQTKDIRLF